MFNYIMKKYAYSKSKLIRVIFSRIRKFCIFIFNDPVCSIIIHNKMMKMPLSHEIVRYLEEFKNYDRLPYRLGRFIKDSGRNICGLDIGANIGDSIAAFCPTDIDVFLAIEANDHFLKFLNYNWKQCENIKILNVLCSSQDEDNCQYNIEESKGTANIQSNSSGIILSTRSIDSIRDEHTSFKNINIIKTDTDGFDFKILEGAKKTIKECKPIVLFECDIFGNLEYVSDISNAFQMFKSSGYSHFLLYDNFGNLMGAHDLSSLTSFYNLMFYQLSSHFHYFDILFMPNDSFTCFYEQELNYFARKNSNEILNYNLEKLSKVLKND